jgi:hypothetical protein
MTKLEIYWRREGDFRLRSTGTGASLDKLLISLGNIVIWSTGGEREISDYAPQGQELRWINFLSPWEI